MKNRNQQNRFPALKGLLLGAFCCAGFWNVCYAESDGRTLINENFEEGYIDRGDVGENISCSESYDGFADTKKSGYMVSKQMTSFLYEAASGDRAGYSYDDRISSGYHQTYGKLGSALCLYPSHAEWWIDMKLGYEGISARELSEKTLDINFSLADSGDSGRTARIMLCAVADGEEKEFLLGYQPIKRGSQFLNSFHKRVKLNALHGFDMESKKLYNIRIRVIASKGQANSTVKLDDLHIREVNPEELTGWDFEAEDCFTKQFSKDTAKLSTVSSEDEPGRMLKLQALKSDAEAKVYFPIPQLTKDSAFRISFSAKAPCSGKIKVGLANIGTGDGWELGEI